jgi:glycosyltransferase involved in cell wall biosynthesis
MPPMITAQDPHAAQGPTGGRGGRLAVLVSFSGAGGVERMMMNLVREFARRGIEVDLLPIRRNADLLRTVPAAVRVVDLRAGHSLTIVPALVRYLRRTRPAALLAAKDRAGRAALLARRLSGVPTRIVVRLGTHLSASLSDSHALQRHLRTLPMRLLYAGVDRVIAVSDGVAADTADLTGLAQQRISVIRNPVVTPELHGRAAQDLHEPWFSAGEPPVILGAGRLTRQKDFATLIRAFARVAARRPCRLLILGEGALRAELGALARRLGVADRVRLTGFVENPYAYMSRAAVFALSSRWEGSPNVLAEALAVGTPVVATDCPSGPREILQDGRYGTLVPVGDAQAMARGIEAALDRPHDTGFLRTAVAEYSVQSSADAYLAALGLLPSRTLL